MYPPPDVPGSPDPPTLALLQRAQAGEASAAEALFARHLPRVREIARVRLGPQARNRWALDSNDVLQEALTRAYRGIDGVRVEREGQFISWMAVVIENTVRELARKAGRAMRDERRKVHAGQQESGDLFARICDCGPTPSEVAMGKELAERYVEALQSLDERQREAILLRRHCEATFAEIAARLDLHGEAQARTLLSRALANLARRLDEGG